MELRIEEFPIANRIDFNFDEIKNEVAEKMHYYASVTYSEEQLAEAKADRAMLNKFIKRLDDRRKEIKDEIMQPYKEFELRLNEIKALVEEPKNLIDTQIKEFEDKDKEEKRERIKAIFAEEVGDREIDWFVLFNPKWLNKTYSEDAIREEIQTAVFHYDNNLPILEQLPEYAEESIKVYKETLDFSKAIGKSLELKEEAEKRKLAELAEEPSDKSWKRLAVYADKEQMDFIHEYLNNAKIPHKRIY